MTSLITVVFALTGMSCAVSDAQLEENLANIELPSGFEISVYASGVINARQMALGDNGTVFVGSRTANKVYALVDTNGDHKADEMYTILEGEKLPDGKRLRMPSGLAFRDGSLYIGAISHILRLDNIEQKLKRPGEPVIVTSQYPSAGHHGWKFIAFGPDGKLYVPVGAPCNTCERDNEIFATITRMDPNGSNIEIVARGVRNTVGFDWHPDTNELWFSENGVDGSGDDMPADELNRMSRTGLHFGFPYVHQGDTLDRMFGQGRKIEDYEPPVQKLDPHVAALGMRFYTGDMFPAHYKNQIFIAEHGSWNRSEKIGYRIMVVKLEGNRAVSYQPFAQGWLQGQNDWGRPADLLFLPDGSMLISDDKANAIYRIAYAE